MVRTMIVGLALILGLTASTFAADGASASEPVGRSGSLVAAAPDLTAAGPRTMGSRLAVEMVPPTEASRGAVLPLLYAGLGALNACDAITTAKGLAAGAAREANPLMRGWAGNAAALWAIKGGATAVTIVGAERLWRSHHRAEAVVVMLISNGVVAAVAAQNLRVVRSR